MDIAYIMIWIVVSIIALCMWFCEYSASTIAGTGGIIASSFWMIYLLKQGIKDRKLEFLAAGSWFVFSVAVIATGLYEDS